MLDPGLQEAEQRLTFPPFPAPFMKAPTGPCDVHCTGAAAIFSSPGWDQPLLPSWGHLQTRDGQEVAHR